MVLTAQQRGAETNIQTANSLPLPPFSILFSLTGSSHCHYTGCHAHLQQRGFVSHSSLMAEDHGVTEAWDTHQPSHSAGASASALGSCGTVWGWQGKREGKYGSVIEVMRRGLPSHPGSCGAMAQQHQPSPGTVL